MMPTGHLRPCKRLYLTEGESLHGIAGDAPQIDWDGAGLTLEQRDEHRTV